MFAENGRMNSAIRSGSMLNGTDESAPSISEFMLEFGGFNLYSQQMDDQISGRALASFP